MGDTNKEVKSFDATRYLAANGNHDLQKGLLEAIHCLPLLSQVRFLKQGLDQSTKLGKVFAIECARVFNNNMLEKVRTHLGSLQPVIARQLDAWLSANDIPKISDMLKLMADERVELSVLERILNHALLLQHLELSKLAIAALAKHHYRFDVAHPESGFHKSPIEIAKNPRRVALHELVDVMNRSMVPYLPIVASSSSSTAALIPATTMVTSASSSSMPSARLASSTGTAPKVEQKKEKSFSNSTPKKILNLIGEELKKENLIMREVEFENTLRDRLKAGLNLVMNYTAYTKLEDSDKDAIRQAIATECIKHKKIIGKACCNMSDCDCLRLIQIKCEPKLTFAMVIYNAIKSTGLNERPELIKPSYLESLRTVNDAVVSSATTAASESKASVVETSSATTTTPTTTTTATTSVLKRDESVDDFGMFRNTLRHGQTGVGWRAPGVALGPQDQDL